MGYTASGWLETTMMKTTGEVMRVIRSGFVVSISNGQWQVTAQYDKPGHFTICGYDGTNTYGYLRDDPSLERIRKQYPKSDTAPAIVSRSDFPAQGAPYTFIPWLACASGPFFDKHGTNYLPSFWNGTPETCQISHAFGCQFKRGKLSGGIPDSLDWVVSGTNLEKLRKGWIPDCMLVYRLGTEEFLQTYRRYVPGRLDAHFNVLSVTNWNSLVLPSEFEFKRYFPVPIGASTKPLRELIRGMVTNLAPCSLSNPRPEIPPDLALSLMDLRYRKLDRGVAYIDYRHEAKVWPSENDPRLLMLLRNTKTNMYQPISRARRIMMVLAIFVLPLIPVGILWAKREKKQTKTNQTVQ